MAHPKQNILSLSIKSSDALYAAYMPFIQNGGLFIPTLREYQMNEEIFLLLGLMDEEEKLPISGKVVWITPPDAHGNKKSGVGIQFAGTDKSATKEKIEGYIADMTNSSTRNHTM